jgi:hypothetical protein
MAQNHSSASTRTDGATVPEGKIRAAHLLVKHNKSRKPSSWREPQITKSLEEATEITKGYGQQIRCVCDISIWEDVLGRGKVFAFTPFAAVRDVICAAFYTAV